MINIDTNAWDERAFEVCAETSGAAVVKVLTHLNAIETEQVLHNIHVGASQPLPTSDAEMASWPADDHFERID